LGRTEATTSWERCSNLEPRPVTAEERGPRYRATEGPDFDQGNEQLVLLALLAAPGLGARGSSEDSALGAGTVTSVARPARAHAHWLCDGCRTRAFSGFAFGVRATALRSSPIPPRF